MGTRVTYYQDADTDGYGNTAVTTSSCSGAPTGYVLNNTDCNDGDSTKWQSGFLYVDADNDNYDAGTATVCYGAAIPTGYKLTTLGTDCNDAIAAIHPGATEICGNGIDDNCNGQVDEGCMYFTGTIYSTVCTGTANGIIEGLTHGGEKPCTYSWSNGAVTESISGLAPGVYTVTVTDILGVTASASFTVGTIVPTAKPATPGTITGAAIVCIGQSYIYAIARVTNASSYTWTVPANTTLVSGQGTNRVVVFFDTAYTSMIKVTATNCMGTSAAKTLSITKKAKLAAPGTITGAVTVCPGSTSSYSIAAVANALSYVWIAPANASITSGQGTTSVSVQFTAGYTTGSLSVAAVNDCGALGTAKTLTVARIALPARPTVNVFTSTICPGSTYTYAVAPVANADSYFWSVDGNATISGGQGTTSASVTFGSGYTAGNVRVYAINCRGNGPQGGYQVSTTVAVPGAITGLTTVCPNTTNVAYSVAPVSGATNYIWTTSAGTITGGQGTTSITMDFPASYSSLTVSVQTATACFTSAAKTMTVKAGLTAGTIFGETGGYCGGISGVHFQINAVTGATGYTWTPPAGATIVSGQNTINATVDVSAAFAGGSICVSADNACGTGTPSCLTLTRKPIMPVGISGNSPVCPTTSQAYSIHPVQGATNYNWNLPNGTWTNLTGQGTTDITVTVGTSGGNLKVFASNACGSSTYNSKTIALATTCRLGEPEVTEETNSSSFQMTLFPNPANGTEVTVELEGVTENASLEVLNVLGETALKQAPLNSGINTLNISNLSSGVYMVVVRDGNTRKTQQLVVER